MTSTGRLHDPLPPALRRMLFGATADEACDSILPAQLDIDRAWVVMLRSCRLATEEEAAQLLGALDALEESRFEALRGRVPVRGTFLLYEQTLVEIGARLAGDLQRARSRNDLNATIVRLRLRRPVARLGIQMLRLIGALRRLAARTADLVVPIYTHGQQALPGSVGHYLTGVAEELLLDAQCLWRCWEDLQKCPLGAGAACGTAVAIDTRLASTLLGFDAPTANSLRAVASRRMILELLSAAAMISVTLSRVGLDLMTWCSEELRFARLPDHLVGSSSHMPQKRNLFLLEHVQARAASAQGAFVAAAAAMTSKPFTNSVAVGTEAVRSVWAPLADVADAVVILRTVLQGLDFDQAAMERHAANGASCAADLAELFVGHGATFREAHREIGELVSQAERAGVPFMEAAVAEAARRGIADAEAYLAPSAVMRRREFGGGTAPLSLHEQGDLVTKEAQQLRQQLRAIRRRHRTAASMLRARADALAQRAESGLRMNNERRSHESD